MKDTKEEASLSRHSRIDGCMYELTETKAACRGLNRLNGIPVLRGEADTRQKLSPIDNC